MSLSNETSTTKVVTDASQAISELGKLETLYAAISRSIKDMTGRTKSEIATRKKMKLEQADFKKRIHELRLEIGAEAMSYTQLNRAMKENRLEMGRLVPTMEGYEGKLKDLLNREKDYKTAIEARKKAMSLPDPEPPKPQKQSWLQSAKGSVSDKIGLTSLKGMTGAAIVGGLAGGAATLGIQAVEKVIDVAMQEMGEAVTRRAEMSKALSGMAAITGLDLVKDAKDLKYYGDMATYMGKKFNMAAPDVVGAMQKIGSIKPELLSAKEALAGLTQEAITLARADGALSVEDAATALVGSLNQFDKGADQSTRFMNVLAASASAGSAEINQVNETFKVSGAVLSASNISFEQSNALVQILGKRAMYGSEAGTALRNTFTRLMTGAKETNPTIVGLNTALENLSKLTPQEMVKMFGLENQVAIKTIIDFRGEVSKLTEEMTGTTEATDQARKRMNNLDEDIQSLGKAWDSIWDLNEGQESSFQTIVRHLTTIFTWVGNINKNWKRTWTDLIPGMAIISTMKAAQETARQAQTAQQKERQTNAKNAGAAEYQKGTSDSNLKNYEGKTQFDKERAYAQAIIKDARREFGKLDRQIKYLERTPVAARAYDLNKMRAELAKVGGKLVAAKNAIPDIDKREFANQEMVRDLERGEKGKKDKEQERALAKAKKHAETLAKQEIDAQNKIAEAKIKAIEDLEEREIWQRQLKYAKELQDLVKQEGDKDELYKSLEESLQEDIAEIQKKYRDERTKEELATAHRLAQAVRNLQISDANNRVREAEAKGNSKGVFDARYDLSKVSEQQKLDETDAFYAKEREKYKLNAVALANVEAAYQKEVLEIQRNGESERGLLSQNFFRDQAIRREQAKITGLGLDAQGAENRGRFGTALELRLQMLDSQMAAELNVADLTEQEKNNIFKRYQLERDQLVKASIDQQAELITGAFAQGLQIVSRFAIQGIQNQETSANDAKVREEKRLNEQLKSGVISQEDFTRRKEKLDERYEKKQNELRKKKAIAEKKAALFEAAIQIPLAILKASPNPVMMALAGGVGLAQLALIAGEKIPEYYQGGPILGEFGKGKVIRAGERGEEWMAPNWQLIDPATRPTLEWLEERRASKTTGFNGTPPPGGSSGGSTVVYQKDPELLAMIKQLSDQIPNIHAKLYTDQMDDYNRDKQAIMDDANVV